MRLWRYDTIDINVQSKTCWTGQLDLKVVILVSWVLENFAELKGLAVSNKYSFLGVDLTETFIQNERYQLVSLLKSLSDRNVPQSDVSNVFASCFTEKISRIFNRL